MCKFLPTHCLVKMGVETPKGKLIVWCINVLGFWILNNFLMILFLKKEFYYVSTFTSWTKQILGICLTLNGSNCIFFLHYIQTNTYLLLEFIINMFSSKTLTLKYFEATIPILIKHQTYLWYLRWINTLQYFKRYSWLFINFCSNS